MIKALRVQNFRVHRDYFVELSDGVNVMVGPNGCGKTSLLEAIHVCLQGKSFRGYVGGAVNTDSSWARIDLNIDNQDITVKIQEKDGRIEKEFIVKGQSKKRLVKTDKQPVVLFEPEDLRIISGSPQRRRDYIDALAIKLDYSHQVNLNKYKKALQQRNALLKSNAADKEFFVWDVQLAEYGGSIMVARKGVIDQIDELITGKYQQTADNKDVVTLEYFSNFDGDLLKKLTENLLLDRRMRSTNYGPHKDDLLINLNGVSARVVASRGESRSLVLALKSSEFTLLTSKFGVEPLLLLDDVFSELDGQRRKALTTLMRDTQTVITTTDADLALSIDDKAVVKPI